MSSHLDDVVSFEESATQFALLGKTSSVDDHLVAAVHSVTALEHYVEVGGEGDENALKHVVRFNSECYRTTEYRIASMHEAFIQVDTFVSLF